jgi:hypothetical protein
MKLSLLTENETSFSELNVFTEDAMLIFKRAIDDYHLYDSIDEQIRNPYPAETISNLLYLKCWIDTVQWHVEDEIRNPDIDPVEALVFKRRIDKLNQDRTNKVEQLDDYFLSRFNKVQTAQQARVNTESPAWALDRLSILALKIYHMAAETNRTDASPDHLQRCSNKLAVLQEQLKDLSLSINELLQDISFGKKRMKVYRQMKMYNDATLNPVLYNGVKV